MKNKIKKRIRKYMTIFCSLLFIPVFCINSYAYTSYDNFPINLGVVVNINNRSGTGYSSASILPNEENVYSVSHTLTNNVYALSFVLNEAYSIPVDIDVFNYYLVGSVYSGVSDINKFLFFPDVIRVIANNHDNTNVNLPISDERFYHNDADNWKGFSYSCKLDLSDYTSFRRIYMDARNTTGTLTLPASLSFEMSVIALPKSMTDGDATAAIVAAINNQTSQLSSQLGEIDSGIDKGNDLIENGTDETQSAVTDFNEIFEDFNEELDKVEEFDTEILDEFNAANEQYLTELNNFTLSGSLLNAGNWLSTSMQTVYDNSSDYKMLWLVPLLLGIPLLILFIKRSDNNE